MEPSKDRGNDGDSTTTDTSAYSNTNILPPVKNNFNMTHKHTHTHTHTTNLHGGLHARQIPSIRTPDFSHTYRGPGNESYRCWEQRLSWLSYLLQNPLHPTRNVSLPHYTPSQTIHTNLDNDNHATIFRPENLNLFCAMEPFDRLVKPTEPFLEKKMYSYTLNKIHRYRIYNYVLHSTL